LGRRKELQQAAANAKIALIPCSLELSLVLLSVP
jgi:hypothetical protein